MLVGSLLVLAIYIFPFSVPQAKILEFKSEDQTQKLGLPTISLILGFILFSDRDDCIWVSNTNKDIEREVPCLFNSDMLVF